MKTLSATICTLLLCASAFPIASFAQQASNSRGPMVREGATIKISAHVFVIPDDSVPGVPNVGIVVGKRATLVIETGMGRANGETVLRETQKVSGKTKLYLVTTHIHPEHDLGAQAFPASTTMIRSRDEVNEIAEVGQQMADAFRKRSPVMAKLLEGAEYRKADIVFDKEHTLDLGGVRVHLIAVGPNHTVGDTIIFVEQDKVPFAGDVAMKGLPMFASPKSSLNHWLLALDRLDALKPRIVVPSHGPIGDENFISGYRTYLTLVRKRTAELKAQGQTLAQATATITTELKPQYPDAGRISGAIRVAYAEVN